MRYLDPATSGNGESATVITRPIPRTTRRSALRAASSQRELHADAREEARLARGRDAFVWRGRMLPIGVPIATAAGVVMWRRRRSAGETMAVVVATSLLAYIEARVEWSVRRRAYTRRRAGDFVRDD